VFESQALISRSLTVPYPTPSLLAICPALPDRLRACDGVTPLFDDHIIMVEGSPRQHGERWTLEQLVDWVRSVEPADEAEKQALNLYAPASAEENRREVFAAFWSGSQALQRAPRFCTVPGMVSSTIFDDRQISTLPSKEMLFAP